MYLYEIKCDRKMVEQWIKEGKLKGTENESIYIRGK
jgi:hypothetical protein